ncbi:Hypothetical predicted protein [Octopus vulgaris]|uniref:Uncharacterized protein n=1 Tax=Octopus vulgaris TaxID=6645 RepID=A0AA36MEY0_OCTVU|nr:Hypothetical predicted protein [Octopus vulgaris]
MLCDWFINCKPEERTVENLRRGLKDAECFAALEYLSLDERQVANAMPDSMQSLQIIPAQLISILSKSTMKICGSPYQVLLCCHGTFRTAALHRNYNKIFGTDSLCDMLK